MPFPVRSTPAFIGHAAGEPSAICHAVRSSALPSSVVASEGAGTGCSLVTPGVTIGGCGRVPSCTRHLPFGCIGVSSYPTGA
jgi:hypothetical protein